MAAAKSAHVIHAGDPHNMHCKGLALEALAKLPTPTLRFALAPPLTSWKCAKNIFSQFVYCWHLEARRMAAAKSVHITHSQGRHNMHCKGRVQEAPAKMK